VECWNFKIDFLTPYAVRTKLISNGYTATHPAMETKLHADLLRHTAAHSAPPRTHAFSFASYVHHSRRPQMWREWKNLLAPGYGGLVLTINLEMQEDDGDNQNNLRWTLAGSSTYDLSRAS